MYEISCTKNSFHLFLIVFWNDIIDSIRWIGVRTIGKLMFTKNWQRSNQISPLRNEFHSWQRLSMAVSILGLEMKYPYIKHNLLVAVAAFWVNFCLLGVLRSNAVIYSALVDVFEINRQNAAWPSGIFGFFMSITGMICSLATVSSYPSRNTIETCLGTYLSPPFPSKNLLYVKFEKFSVSAIKKCEIFLLNSMLRKLNILKSLFTVKTPFFSFPFLP